LKELLTTYEYRINSVFHTKLLNERYWSRIPPVWLHYICVLYSECLFFVFYMHLYWAIQLRLQEC